MDDLCLRGGLVIDGTGTAPRIADVGVRAAKISAVGHASNANEVVDVSGLVVAPGFIDMHTHSDFTIFRNPLAPHAVKQGVTTEVIGNCGFSIAPISDDHVNEWTDLVRPLGEGLGWTWRSYQDALQSLDEARPVQNFVPLVGHGAVRCAVMGMEARNAQPDEIAEMVRLIREARSVGCWGMSTGLIYPPGVYAGEDELRAIVGSLAESHGLYATHMRDEGDGVLAALDESIDVATRNPGVRLQVSHLKAAGPDNIGKVSRAVERIQDAQQRGLAIHADFYPYEAVSTFLSALIPPWAHEGGVGNLIRRLAYGDVRQRLRREILESTNGWWNPYRMAQGWDKIIIVSLQSDRNRDLEGLTVAEAGRRRSKDPLDLVFELLIEERGAALMAAFVVDAQDLRLLAGWADAAIGSDSVGVATPTTRVHPRAYGSFARFLSQYVVRDGLIPWEEGIRRMTGLAAEILGLTDRGRLKLGSYADVTVVDPSAISDRATYANPIEPATGIVHVLINGEFVIREGKATERRPGKMILDPRAGTAHPTPSMNRDVVPR